MDDYADTLIAEDEIDAMDLRRAIDQDNGEREDWGDAKEELGLDDASKPEDQFGITPSRIEEIDRKASEGILEGDVVGTETGLANL